MAFAFAPRFAPELRAAFRLLEEPIFRPGLSRFVALSEGGRKGPAINLEENASAFVVDAEVPGWRREDLTIEIKEDENQVLVISGKRTNPAEKTSEHIDVDKELDTQLARDESTTWLNERSTDGGFTRSFRLPSQVDAEQVKARLADGLLHLELPKSAKPQPKTVAIE